MNELQKDSFNQHGLQIDLKSALLCVSDFSFDTNTTPYIPRYPFRAQNLSLFTSPTDMVQGWGRRLIA